MSREIHSIIQRVIPILVNSCDIERSHILTDCSTKLTSPKRGDIWIGKTEVSKPSYEQNIILLIEIKDEQTKPLRADEIYNNIDKGEYSLKNEFKKAFYKDLKAYEKGFPYKSAYKTNKWFDALIQGRYKAEKQGLHFFAVSNTSLIKFYHTNTLKPIFIKKKNEVILLDFWIKESLLIELYNTITPQTNVLTIGKVETVIDNPSEYEFQRFLKKIHNQNVFRFNEEIIIDSLLTFVFFKFLQEKMHQNNERIPLNGCLWDCFKKGAKKGDEGKVIINNMYLQLSLLKDKDSDYNQVYKEFTPILKVPDELRTKPENYPVIYDIWKEFSRYNFHGCGFDIYGGIYEVFAKPKTKEQLGQFYTRRHISRILAYLTLKDKKDIDEKYRICDPACGTGGLLTECYNIIRENTKEYYGGEVPEKKDMLLSTKVFYGNDIVPANVEKAKLNMFFAGDGHTNILKKDSIKHLPKIITEDDSEGYNVIIANPPYGNGSEWYKSHVTWMNTKRHELVFIERMIKALKYGGKFGFVVPDGVLENPRWQEFREQFIEQVKIEAIISVPVHAFAPYCKQKTYLIIGQRRTFNQIVNLTKDKDFEQKAKDKSTIQSKKISSLNEKIWFYIIDFDGFANSDKRFPTDLSKVDDNGEIEFLHNDLFELKEKYLIGEDGKGNIIKYEQIDLDGSKKGELKRGKTTLHKAGFFTLNKEITFKKWYVLHPETYLRPYEPRHISIEDFRKEKKIIEMRLKSLLESIT